MALTGRPGAPPLGPPRPLVPGLAAVADAIATDSGVRLDPLALLGERAALRGFRRAGDTSCGGHTRLLRTADGWLAVSLARPDDLDLVPAWLELAAPVADPWPALATELSTRDTAAVVARGRLLGLPVAALGADGDREPVARAQLGEAPPCDTFAGLTIVDLSSLWAGPLAAGLLQQAGATVVKVESRTRPDALRHGDPELFDRLNAGKRSVVLDLGQPAGVADLRRLLASADVVVEASRPRALEQWGLRAEELIAGGPRVWVSITGYGRAAPGRDWVAFGDDAAVAGGLVVRDTEGPCFCADAVADPASGLFAAAATMQALHGGGRWLLDVSMAAVAARLAGPTIEGYAGEPAPPRSRPSGGPANPFGADTAFVMSTVE
jgi:hypothetical protein